MLDDPATVILEFHRILKPGGGVILYTAVTTELLEPQERRRLTSALDSPEWWSEGRGPIDSAIERSGFDVLEVGVRSPEHSEALLLTNPSDVADQLVRVAQLRRERSALAAALGTKWYERWLAWSHWEAYLILGKIETVAWVLRKPRHPPAI